MSTTVVLTKRMGTLLCLLGLFAQGASAHRLDEYLQATRITIEVHRIQIALDLTPGAAVADGIFNSMDLNHDGTLSTTEREAYAQSVMNAVLLTVDARPQIPKVEDAYFPTIQEMRNGEGVIRLRGTAVVSEILQGKHHLAFSNSHRADIGVYLVNALVPQDERIHITAQSRDVLQQRFSLDYSVTLNENKSLYGIVPLLVSAAMATALFTLSRRRLRSSRHKTLPPFRAQGYWP
jgi:hypothetical protein